MATSAASSTCETVSSSPLLPTLGPRAGSLRSQDVPPAGDASDGLIRRPLNTDGVDRRNLLATIAGFAAAAAVFAVMFWIVDAGEVLAEVRGADPALVAVVATAILCWNVAWGIALWNVLAALEIDAPVHVAVGIHAAAAFGNHITPFAQAGGEPINALLISRVTDTEYEVSLASITSFDAINVVPSLTFATAGALYLLVARPGVHGLGLVPVAVVGGAMTVALLVGGGWLFRRGLRVRLRSVGRTLGGGATRLLPGLDPAHVEALGERVRGFAGAVGRLAVDRRRLAVAIAFSTLGWGLQAVGLWVTFLALDTSIPLVVPFFVLPLGRVGGALPTPGGLGGTEAIVASLLAVLTVADGATIAAAVTIHSVGGYLLTTSVGAAAASALVVSE